jgi:hypothetical protein
MTSNKFIDCPGEKSPPDPQTFLSNPHNNLYISQLLLLLTMVSAILQRSSSQTSFSFKNLLFYQNHLEVDRSRGTLINVSSRILGSMLCITPAFPFNIIKVFMI